MQPKGFQQTTGLDTEGHVNTPFRLYPQWSVGLCSSSSHRFSIHLDSRYMMTHPPIIHHHLNSTSQGLELAIGEPDLDHKLKTMIKVQFWMVSCYSQCHIIIGFSDIFVYHPIIDVLMICHAFLECQRGWLMVSRSSTADPPRCMIFFLNGYRWGVCEFPCSETDPPHLIQVAPRWFMAPSIPEPRVSLARMSSSERNELVNKRSSAFPKSWGDAQTIGFKTGVI